MQPSEQGKEPKGDVYGQPTATVHGVDGEGQAQQQHEGVGKQEEPKPKRVANNSRITQ